jgi:hypothetical protein
LITILLEKGGGFSHEIVRTISDLLTFEKTSSLVSISKEVYEGELILFKAPKEWLDGDQVRLMFDVMMGMAESRWKMRVDASMVEKLMLGVKNFEDRHKTNDVTPAWLRFLGEQMFPKLISVDLNYCSNITDAGLTEVGRGCPNLQTLNLSCCRNITDAGLMEVGRGCQNLQTLNLSWSNITDAGLMEVGRGCTNLQTLNLFRCSSITDAGVMEVGRGCQNLQTLNLSVCRNITDACKNALQQSHPQLSLDG